MLLNTLHACFFIYVYDYALLYNLCSPSPAFRAADTTRMRRLSSSNMGIHNAVCVTVCICKLADKTV